MMAKSSEFTRVIQNLGKEADAYRQRAAKSQTVPIGQERLSRSEARTRVKTLTPADLQGMTPELREKLLHEVGTERVLDILRRGG
jgi:hypothetical protein